MAAEAQRGADARRAVVCRCAWSRRVDPAAADAVAAAARAAGWTVRVINDLCEAAARRAEWWVEWLREGGGLIVACRPRAVRALAAHTLDGAPVAVRCVDLVGADPQEAAQRAGVDAVPTTSTEELPASDAPPDGWLPWFPVIDSARCTACGQCVEFCLFGVYERRDGRVHVVRPANCKPHCPACARICPQVAIIFPKHTEPPFEGAEITDEETERARALRRQLEWIGRGDLRAALAERRRLAASRGAPSRPDTGAGP